MARDWRDSVHPVLVRKVEAVLGEMGSQKVGKPMRPVSGFRSPAQQWLLYGKGRWLPGPKVTTVTLGMHNLGLAVDCAFVVNGKVTWEVPQSWWQEYGWRCERRGLVWGGRWTSFKDFPHVQLVSVSEQAGLKAVWRETKNLARVWQKVEERGEETGRAA